MAEFVLLCVPTLSYVVVQSRGDGRTFRAARQRAGVAWGTPAGYGTALLLLLPLLLAGWLATVLIPGEALGSPGVTVARVTSLSVTAGIVLRAVGEEVCFRGLLGGVLIRRLGFGWGNLAQALLFLLPHGALLLVDVRMWPVLPAQFAAGWLLGWLRDRADTFVPGAAVHVIANVAAGLLAA